MRFALLLLVLAGSAQAEWRVARPGWEYQFPRDHGSHPEFKTEWWYFTGNLTAKGGRPFGYQLTFFRQGIQSGDEDVIPLSRFVIRDVKFAHFTVSDLSTGKFHFFQKLSRGAYDEAGFGVATSVSPTVHKVLNPPSESNLPAKPLAWIDDWTCELTGENTFRLRAAKDDVSLDLRLTSAKPPVVHGRNGISRKAAGDGRASHYYSLTRLTSEGLLRIGSEEFSVHGKSWFDHEWSTNQLAEDQVGWDWFSLQFDDGSELMLFQIRTKEGGRDRFSSGTFLDAKGTATEISQTDFTLDPGTIWQSPQSGGRYPTTWQIAIPRLDLKLDVRAALNDQELRLKPVVYWEGSVRATGTIHGQTLKASGYLEMTGYLGPIAGMQSGR